MKTLQIINDNGFSGYIVGGAVRNALLNKKINDYDICSNALPEDIRKIFLENNYKVIETGIKHGTVTVVNNNSSFEITTFRIDGDYLDNRHPSDVNFSLSLEEDLKRRDFTVNALACDINGNVLDFHNGIKDLHDKIIRTVGDANKRFNEDALRMLRAIRFSACLGFEIEQETKNAIMSNINLIKNVSIERINQEMNKILDYSFNINFSEYEDLFRACYNYNIKLVKKDYTILNRFPDYLMKVAYLFSFYDKEELNKKLIELKISNEKKHQILMFIENSEKLKEDQFDNYRIKKYLSSYGLEDGFILIQYICYLNNIDILFIKSKIELLTNEVVDLKTLNIDGLQTFPQCYFHLHWTH